MDDRAWDKALLCLLTNDERAALNEALEAFLEAELPSASTRTLNETADVFEDEMEGLAPDEQVRGWIFAALLRAKAAAEIEP